MAKFSEAIEIHGAKEHNLKNISLQIPRNQITVITGLSGSGKSSLAFDTIYAEGQRRYVDSLSTYARNFLEKLKKPNVDSISGLSPAIAIDQKSVGLNPRSTVGTVTEIYDYLRLLYARIGEPKCPDHGCRVEARLPDQIITELLSLSSGTRFYVLAPVVQGKKGEFYQDFQKWIKQGYVRARIDGDFIELSKAKKLAKTKTHDIDIVVDRLVMKADLKSRIADSVHRAIGLANGQVVVETLSGTTSIVANRMSFSIHSACPECGYSFPALEPRFFSFNNPRGACPTCKGLGTIDIEEAEDQSDSVSSFYRNVQYHVAERARNKANPNEESDDEIDMLAIRECPDCHGTRLNRDARNVFIADSCITDLAHLPASELLEKLNSAQWSKRDTVISEKILKQIRERLEYIKKVGAGYLSLDRPTRTLSGGENQRIRLASQVGSSLIGILYVLDEPSIGLHPRDHERLLGILRELRNVGNTILMVEHDEETIRTADFVVDLGPRAGKLGGDLIAAGTPNEIASNKDSITGRYLNGSLRTPIPSSRRIGNGHALMLKGARSNSLKNVDVNIPLGTFTSITGVSGSGKSTLIMDTLYRALANHFYRSKWSIGEYDSLEGLEFLDKVIDINQSPIGRTPRSTPSTYVGLFPLIRDLYASLPDSKIRGYGPGRFSFNVKGGRCEACQGAGQIRVEMHFLSNVFVECETCHGKRYNNETLSIRYKDKSIADVLEMSVHEALDFFKNHLKIYRKLSTLNKVGLDYISLGQSSTTLSGGEAQRVKLSKELSKRGTGKTLYILDEPTTGLHFDDVTKLVELLHSLVEQGNSVIVIEHNMDVVRSSDYVIDLGPEGGNHGGEVVCAGPPEEVAKCKRSVTGKFLKL